MDSILEKEEQELWMKKQIVWSCNGLMWCDPGRKQASSVQMGGQSIKIIFMNKKKHYSVNKTDVISMNFDR